MIFTQTVFLGYALYYTTIMFHNWILIYFNKTKENIEFKNVAVRLALCWCLFYLFYNL